MSAVSAKSVAVPGGGAPGAVALVQVFAQQWSPAETRVDNGIDPADTRDVELSRRGDDDAFTRLVQRHQAMVARQMWRFTRDPEDHAELIQEVFIAAFTSLHSYRGDGPFGHWLRKIAVRTGYEYWRKRKRDRVEIREDVGQLLDSQSQEADVGEAVVAADFVEQVLSQLPPRDRLVLTLRYLEEQSVGEIAEATGWSQSMVKVQAWRARKKLEKVLASS